ncbi:hypothetical protein Tco_1076360 [Tanacetum coccineum]
MKSKALFDAADLFVSVIHGVWHWWSVGDADDFRWVGGHMVAAMVDFRYRFHTRRHSGLLQKSDDSCAQYLFVMSINIQIHDDDLHTEDVGAVLIPSAAASK